MNQPTCDRIYPGPPERPTAIAIDGVWFRCSSPASNPRGELHFCGPHLAGCADPSPLHTALRTAAWHMAKMKEAREMEWPLLVDVHRVKRDEALRLATRLQGRKTTIKAMRDNLQSSSRYPRNRRVTA